MRIDRVKFATELAKKDMTLVRLAKITGISRPTLSAVKCGRSCTDVNAAKIAKGLGVKLEELLEKVKAPAPTGEGPEHAGRKEQIMHGLDLVLIVVTCISIAYGCGYYDTD